MKMLALIDDHPPCLLFEQLFLESRPEDIRADTNIADHQELEKRTGALSAARDMCASVTTAHLSLKATS
jgi:hypothetical protein